MQRVNELDSIRGVAALVIVFYHLSWVRLGLLGTAVDLFFVLSGYLITSILLSHPPSRGFLFAFYARRGLRIWPIYYLSLLILVMINPWTPVPGRLDGLPYSLTFTQFVPYYWSDSAPAFIPAFRHTWSLAVEEQFYLIWPALLWLVGRKGLTASATALIGCSVLMRSLGFNRWILATNCDALALGAILASLLNESSRTETRRGNPTLYLALALASAAYWVASAVLLQFVTSRLGDEIVTAVRATEMLSLHIVFFAMVGLTVLHAGHPWLYLLRDRRLVYFGQISYGLYLYHHIIFILWDDYATKLGLGNHVVWDLAKVGASVAVAALSYRFIECPILRWKDRFPYRAAPPRDLEPRGEWLPVTGAETG
jgi:peptidoglycan/LPS O-acetylase OafA/YrhL